MFGNRVRLDRGLYEKCRRYAAERGYSSVDECIAHILEKEIGRSGGPAGMDKDVADQLKGLGYVE